MIENIRKKIRGKGNKIILTLAICLCTPALAQEGASVKARLLGIDDRNTLLVERLDKPGVKINVRLRGVQLPHHDGACAFERGLADEATARIFDLVGGKDITLRHAAPGPDALTADVDVFNHEGVNIAEYLMYQAVLAHPTDTGTRMNWCGYEKDEK